MRSLREKAIVEGAIYYAYVYGVISFVLALVALFLLYVICSKKYKLNWFEKDLLERTRIVNLNNSHNVLFDVISKSNAGNSRSVSDQNSEDKFWVPGGTNARKSDDLPDYPSTPAESRTSNISPEEAGLEGWEYNLTPQPFARNEKQILLSATHPVKPRVSSMKAKLAYPKIDASLYPKEVGCPGTGESLGSIHIAISYDPAAGILSVRLIEARDLIPRDVNDSADPYAKIRLLPDRKNVWQTRVDKKTLNPVFDEDFVFEVRPSAVCFRTLEIILYDFDAYSRHHSLGRVKLNLSDIDLSEKVVLWKNLEKCSHTHSKAELGDLMVSLTFLPNAERLTAIIVKARNLRMVDDSRTTTDAFVKVCLVHGSKRLKKRKTTVQKNTINPVFNEHLTFDVNKKTLSKSFIEFLVYHDSKSGPCELIGSSTVSLSSPFPEEKQFFQDMLSSKTAVTKWLELKDSEEKVAT